ncbi:MAG: hypothetical protein NUV58_04310, partial [Candidatus Roizmanbacteria bacterium]|nr:hypothetical protein [Candidatus Roizmanbacteria bacterium]
QQKAAFDCDASIPGDCKAKGKAYEGSEQQEADRKKKKQEEIDEKRAKEEGALKADGSCPSGFHRCDGIDLKGRTYKLCGDNNKTCNSAAADMGYTILLGTSGSGNLCADKNQCDPNALGWGNYTAYLCSSSQYESANSVCNGNTTDKKYSKMSQLGGCFCGVVQIDNNDNEQHISYKSSCGCNKEEKTTLDTITTLVEIAPSPTPTNTTVPTSTPTSTIVPTTVPTVPEATPTEIIFVITPTITPTPTIAKLVCATKDCNETTRPCAPGNICIKANDGSNYCSNESLVDSCKSSPTESSCCKIVPTSNATPTEIILAKTSISPTAVAKLLETGVVKSFIYLIPAAIMLIGLIL